MNKFWPRVVLVFMVLSIVGLSILADGMISTQPRLSSDEDYIFKQVNIERRKAGVKPLTIDFSLVRTARAKAKDMVMRNYFSHTSPTLGDPAIQLKRAGIPFRTMGENIAGNRTAKGAMASWMKSSGHRKNILNPSFKKIGIGVVKGSRYGQIMVQQFVG